MKDKKEKAGRSDHLAGPREQFNADCGANDSTRTGGDIKRLGWLRTAQAEAECMEEAAAILSGSHMTNVGPHVERLARGLELLLRKEAARTRGKVRNGRSLSDLFEDTERAEAA